MIQPACPPGMPKSSRTSGTATLTIVLFSTETKTAAPITLRACFARFTLLSLDA